MADKVATDRSFLLAWGYAVFAVSSLPETVAKAAGVILLLAAGIVIKTPVEFSVPIPGEENPTQCHVQLGVVISAGVFVGVALWVGGLTWGRFMRLRLADEVLRCGSYYYWALTNLGSTSVKPLVRVEEVADESGPIHHINWPRQISDPTFTLSSGFLERICLAHVERRIPNDGPVVTLQVAAGGYGPSLGDFDTKTKNKIWFKVSVGSCSRFQ